MSDISLWRSSSAAKGWRSIRTEQRKVSSQTSGGERIPVTGGHWRILPVKITNARYKVIPPLYNFYLKKVSEKLFQTVKTNWLSEVVVRWDGPGQIPFAKSDSD